MQLNKYYYFLDVQRHLNKDVSFSTELTIRGVQLFSGLSELSEKTFLLRTPMAPTHYLISFDVPYDRHWAWNCSYDATLDGILSSFNFGETSNEILIGNISSKDVHSLVGTSVRLWDPRFNFKKYFYFTDYQTTKIQKVLRPLEREGLG